MIPSKYIHTFILNNLFLFGIEQSKLGDKSKEYSNKKYYFFIIIIILL